MILAADPDAEGSLKFIYLFVFGNHKSAFVFQGLGKNNDNKPTERLYESFLENLELAE